MQNINENEVFKTPKILRDQPSFNMIYQYRLPYKGAYIHTMEITLSP